MVLLGGTNELSLGKGSQKEREVWGKYWSSPRTGMGGEMSSPGRTAEILLPTLHMLHHDLTTTGPVLSTGGGREWGEGTRGERERSTSWLHVSPWQLLTLISAVALMRRVNYDHWLVMITTKSKLIFFLNFIKFFSLHHSITKNVFKLLQSDVSLSQMLHI